MVEDKKEMFYCWKNQRDIMPFECPDPVNCKEGVAKGGRCLGKYVKRKEENR